MLLREYQPNEVEFMYSSPVHFNFFFSPSVPAAYNNNTFASSPVFFSSSFYYFKLTIILIAVC
jgi:hypothetical protein